MSLSAMDPAVPAFETITLDELERIAPEELDDLSFGVVGMSAEGLVKVYNETESRLAGLSADTVMGLHFFTGVAQCMNNFMVAQHFEDEERLDLTVDYVLTFRMRPTPVRVRLLKHPASALHYVLILRLW